MALGVPRWKTIFKIVIGTGKTGLLTGIIIGYFTSNRRDGSIIIYCSDKQLLCNKPDYAANRFTDGSNLQLCYYLPTNLG